MKKAALQAYAGIQAPCTLFVYDRVPLVIPNRQPVGVGGHEWTRTIDPHHVKVVL